MILQNTRFIYIGGVEMRHQSLGKCVVFCTEYQIRRGFEVQWSSLLTAIVREAGQQVQNTLSAIVLPTLYKPKKKKK